MNKTKINCIALGFILCMIASVIPYNYFNDQYTELKDKYILELYKNNENHSISFANEKLAKENIELKQQITDLKEELANKPQ